MHHCPLCQLLKNLDLLILPVNVEKYNSSNSTDTVLTTFVKTSRPLKDTGLISLPNGFCFGAFARYCFRSWGSSTSGLYGKFSILRLYHDLDISDRAHVSPRCVDTSLSKASAISESSVGCGLKQSVSIS